MLLPAGIWWVVVTLAPAAAPLELPWLTAAKETLRPPLITRADGVRIRFGTIADAPDIRSLWAANAAPNALTPAWSRNGVARSFARRRSPGGGLRATSAVARDASGALVGFLAANAVDEPYNEASAVPWRDFVEAGVARCLVGPVCVAEASRGSGLFEDLYRALVSSDDLAAFSELVSAIEAGNAASLRAHLRLPGAATAGEFADDGGSPWAVVRFDLGALRAAYPAD